MSDRVDYYFRQRVTEAELDLGFTELENADHNLAADLGFTGVLANAVVSQHAPVADLTVDVSGPGAALDQLGQRIFFSALQNVNLAQDDNGVSTDVSGAGKEKVVSVFVLFDRALSDPRVDGNSLTVFFRRDESFKFSVVQGAEAPAGTAIPPPLQSSAILLADITRGFAQSQVLAANISAARRQDAFVLTGTPRSIRRGRTIEAVSDLLSYFNAHVNGASDRHPAASIDYAGGGNWADGTTNPTTTVEAQLDKLVADLAAASGAPKVGAAATAGAPNALGAGTVKSQLDALLGFLNAHINQAAGAHAASAVTYAGGGNWADGTTNPASTVEAQIDKVVADLSAATGAPKVGAGATAGTPNSLVAGTVRSQLDALLGFINGHINQAAGAHAATAITYAGGGAWADGTTNPATTADAQLTKIVADLTALAGAARIGAAASGNLPAGTVRSQLNALDATSVRTNVANVFTAMQTFNGAAGDTNAALETTSAPTTRKLLWEFAINGNYKGRLYSSTSYNGAFEFTINARWDGTQWVRDSTLFAEKWTFHNYEWRVDVRTTTGNFADSAWDGFFSVAFGSAAPKNISIDVNGELNSSGPLTGYSATEGEWGSTAANIGGGASFASGRLPAAASSITFTVKSQTNTNNSPSAFVADRMGVGWFAGTTGALPGTRYMFLTFSAT
jgi:hypothetical protein